MKCEGREAGRSTSTCCAAARRRSWRPSRPGRPSPLRRRRCGLDRLPAHVAAPFLPWPWRALCSVLAPVPPRRPLVSSSPLPPAPLSLPLLSLPLLLGTRPTLNYIRIPRLSTPHRCLSTASLLLVHPPPLPLPPHPPSPPPSPLPSLDAAHPPMPRSGAGGGAGGRHRIAPEQAPRRGQVGPRPFSPSALACAPARRRSRWSNCAGCPPFPS